jgi:hypothetical protein
MMRSYIAKYANCDAVSCVTSFIKLATIGAFSMLTTIPALAHDIPCETSVQSTERVICDHAILNSEYGHIREQQIKLVATSDVSQDTIDQWKRDLYSCTDVSCVDTKFAAWDDIASAVRSTALAQKVASSSTEEISESASSAATVSPPDTSSTTEIPVPEAAVINSQVSVSPANSGSEGHTGGTFLGGFGAAFVLFLFFKVVRRKSKNGRVPLRPVKSSSQRRVTGQRPHDDDETEELSLQSEVAQMRAEQREMARQHARSQEEANCRIRKEKEEGDRQAFLQRQEQFLQQKEQYRQQRERASQMQKEKEAERRRAAEEKKKYESCKYCGSSGRGGCLMSPHKVHERLSDGKHCVFCGSTGTGACTLSPFKKHQR